MTRILFCGQFKSPFIAQDYELLCKYFVCDYVNLDMVQATREGFIHYGLSFLIDMVPKIIRCDVVYIWFADYPALPLILASKLFGKRTILTVGGWEVANFPEINYGNQLNYIRGNVTNWCLRNANVVLIPSNAYKNIINTLEPSANVHVVPNALYDDNLCHVGLPVKKDKIVTALYVNNSKTSLLKGISTFEEACKKLPYDYEIYSMMPHDELIKKFMQSKVYCQLSYTESFGVTNLEAMACGCVPVVSNRDALPEIVGNSGIIVPHGDVDKTSEAIKFAMNMDGSAARERAKQFSRGKRLDMLANFIKHDSRDPPLISVVVPSYNSRKWLPETIASINTQSHKNIEIIIVDDCSTDNTENIVKTLMNNYSNIIYIKNDVNRGECISSRIGFEMARGDYICRLSSDDVYINIKKLENQLKHMIDNKVDWSYNSINRVGESIFMNDVVESYWMVIPSRYGHEILQRFDNYILKFPRFALLCMLARGNPVNSSTLMFKADSYKKYDKWTDEHRTDCDGMILMENLLRGTKGLAIREEGALYRVHPDQMSYNPKYLEETKVIRKKIINKILTGDYPFWLKWGVKLIRRFKHDF